MACGHLVAFGSGAYGTSRFALVGVGHLMGMNSDATITLIAATTGRP